MAAPDPNAHTPELRPEIARLLRERDRLASMRYAPNTVEGYRYAWSIFERWCRRMDICALPASVETVSLFVVDQLLTGIKASTINHRASAIAYIHRTHRAGKPVGEEVLTLLTASRREKGEEPRRMRTITTEQLREIAGRLAGEGTAAAARDRALLVIGFASALRRTNLVQIQMSDVEIQEQGLILRIGKEKQDQEHRGRLIGLERGQYAATCPVRSLLDWLRFRGWADGFLFNRLNHGAPPLASMSGETLRKIVKAAVSSLGIDATDYAGHSLRASLITAAGERNVSPLVIAEHTGHRSLDTLKIYFRRTSLWQANPTGMVGL